MKTVIVLAMHGMPPGDFPRQEAAEFFALHARFAQAPGTDSEELRRRYEALDTRMRVWPRTPENDPFFDGSEALASALRTATGLDVIVGFNEFCAPRLEEALAEAADRGAEHVVVVTPMMTRGGEHSESDIPEAIRRARARFPHTRFDYAWPFDPHAVANFLAGQIARINTGGAA